MTESIVWFLGLLFTKHLIADFILQTPYMYLNKGKLGHPGGLLHAFIHAISTYFIAYCMFDVQFANTVFWLDFGIHYVVDLLKVKINSHYGLKPDNSEKYWWLLGFDQWVHSMTYVMFVFLILK